MSKSKSKYEQSYDLIGWGLNSPAYTKLFNRDELVKFLNKIVYAEKTHEKISIRQESSIGTSRYSKINIDKNEFVRDFTDGILDDKLPIIVTPGIPLEKVWAGNITFYDDEFILEAITGPCSVKHFNHSKRKSDVSVISNIDSLSWRNIDTSLIDIIEKAYSVPLEHYYLEWSYFDVPVGALKSFSLFWEYEKRNKEKDSLWIQEIYLHQLRKRIIIY